MERGERAHVPRGEGADGEGIGPKRQQERSADGESRGSARGEGTGGEGRDLQVERAQGDLGGGAQANRGESMPRGWRLAWETRAASLPVTLAHLSAAVIPAALFSSAKPMALRAGSRNWELETSQRRGLVLITNEGWVASSPSVVVMLPDRAGVVLERIGLSPRRQESSGQDFRQGLSLGSWALAGRVSLGSTACDGTWATWYLFRMVT